MASSYRKVSTRWQCVIFIMIGKILTSFLYSTGKDEAQMSSFVKYQTFSLCYRSKQFEAIRSNLLAFRKTFHILLISSFFEVFPKHISKWEHKTALVDICQLRFIHLSHQNAPLGVTEFYLEVFGGNSNFMLVEQQNEFYEFPMAFAKSPIESLSQHFACIQFGQRDSSDNNNNIVMSWLEVADPKWIRWKLHFLFKLHNWINLLQNCSKFRKITSFGIFIQNLWMNAIFK